MGIRKRHDQKLVVMIELALLTAAVLILQLTGAAIKITPGTTINLVLLPIALGAMLLGPVAGAWLGFVCGLVVCCSIFGIKGNVAGNDNVISAEQVTEISEEDAELTYTTEQN